MSGRIDSIPHRLYGPVGPGPRHTYAAHTHALPATKAREVERHVLSTIRLYISLPYASRAQCAGGGRHRGIVYIYTHTQTLYTRMYTCIRRTIQPQRAAIAHSTAHERARYYIVVSRRTVPPSGRAHRYPSRARLPRPKERECEKKGSVFSTQGVYRKTPRARVHCCTCSTAMSPC